MNATIPTSKITLTLLQRLNFSRQGNRIPVRRSKRPHPITSGWVPSHLLYARVLNNREKYQPQIAALRKAGLDDPFEEAPEIKANLEKLFEKYKPKNNLDKAVLLCRSIIPSNLGFMVGSKVHDRECFFYRGFNKTEGGLEINPGRGPKIFLPKELLRIPTEARVANCLEYSFLLTVLLRTAGIKAFIKAQIISLSAHAYVIALQGENKYKLDLTVPIFELITENVNTHNFNTDDESIARHYNNKGDRLCKQGKLDDAINAHNIALEIKPNYADAWNDKGVVLEKQDKLDDAIEAFNMALKNDHNNVKAWNNKGVVLREQGKLDDAIDALRTALNINPRYANAWKNLGIALKMQGKPAEANEAFVRAFKFWPKEDKPFSIDIDMS